MWKIHRAFKKQICTKTCTPHRIVQILTRGVPKYGFIPNWNKGFPDYNLQAEWPNPGRMITNKSADKTCRKVEALFMRVGPPIQLVTDNGANFTSKKFTALMIKYGVEHAKCSPHHHQGNGLAKNQWTPSRDYYKRFPAHL